MSIDVVFTSSSNATGGGRNDHVRSATGRIDLDTRHPVEMGGDGQDTNPEELFSAAWTACFLGAVRLVADNARIGLDDATDVPVEVGLGKDEVGGFGLTGHITGRLPGLAQDVADDVMQQAHEACPYSKATRRNISVDITAQV